MVPTKKSRIKPTKPRVKSKARTFARRSVPWRELASERIENYSEPGHMVRTGRYKADLTQQELADQLAILPHHISEMEHGKRPIGKKMAQALGKALKVDYRVFL